MRILIVDDEPLTRSFLKNKIPGLNGRCAVAGTAGSGREALAFLERESADLLITDIKMPDMDGLELCEQVSRRHPDLLMAVLSGYDDFSYAQQAIRSGVREYLLKPIVNAELERLLEKMVRIVEKRREESTLRDATSSWLRAQYLQALALRMKNESDGCLELMDEEDLRELRRPFWLFLFALPDPDAGGSAAEARAALLQRGLRRWAGDAFPGQGRGDLFGDSAGNTALVLPRGCDPARLAKAARRHPGGEAPEEYWAALAAGETPEDLARCCQDAGDLLLYPQLTGEGRFFSPRGVYEREPFQPLDYGTRRWLAGLRRPLDAFCGAALSGDPLFLTNQLNRVYAQAAQEERFARADGALRRLGLLLLRRIDWRAAPCGYPAFSARLLEAAPPDARLPGKPPEEFLRLFTDLCRLAHRGPRARQEPGHGLVERCKEHILLHYDKPLSLSAVADDIGVSANYLSGVFHRETGESYIKYLTRVRMEAAARLLSESPGLRLGEVAERTGYVNSKHFLSVFKKYFGVTPGEYRAAGPEGGALQR